MFRILNSMVGSSDAAKGLGREGVSSQGAGNASSRGRVPWGKGEGGSLEERSTRGVGAAHMSITCSAPAALEMMNLTHYVDDARISAHSTTRDSQRAASRCLSPFLLRGFSELDSRRFFFSAHAPLRRIEGEGETKTGHEKLLEEENEEVKSETTRLGDGGIEIKKLEVKPLQHTSLRS